MLEIHEHGPRRSPSPTRLLPLVAMFAAIALSACTGVVMSPADETSVTGQTRFWGYAIQANQAINLEAQNSSNQWETLGSTTSGTTPTYAGNQTGYYYQLDYNPKLVPARFKRAAPWSGYSRVHFRIKSPSLNPAETRRYNAVNNPPQGVESNLERAWAVHRGDGILRIDFQN